MTPTEICKATIELQEKMKNCYFWNSPTSAGERRNYEKKYSQEFEFNFDGNHYKFIQDTRCTCANIYFSSEFYVNGEKKDIRAVKKLLKQLEK